MNHYEYDNIGGFRSVDIIMHNLPISINPVYLPLGSSWINIPIKDETGEMLIKIYDSPNGAIYSYTGTMFLHNLRDEVDEVMIPFCGKAIAMLRITDMNGRVYIIGSPDVPVTIEMAGTTGKKYTNENGAAYNFSVEQPFVAARA